MTAERPRSDGAEATVYGSGTLAFLMSVRDRKMPMALDPALAEHPGCLLEMPDHQT